MRVNNIVSFGKKVGQLKVNHRPSSNVQHMDFREHPIALGLNGNSQSFVDWIIKCPAGRSRGKH